MRFDKSTRLLVVAAHPDDEVLACGGTLARAVDAGALVKVVFLGEGISARFPLGDYGSKAFHEQTERRTPLQDFSPGKRFWHAPDNTPRRPLGHAGAQ